MSNRPLVSVILCTYNASEFINNTLSSVRDQTYENLEILILDNNSSDDTVAKIRTHMDSDPRITLYQEGENLGCYPGLNYLIERTNGDYIAIQDHDDIWHREKINLQISFLESNQSYIGCGGLPIKFYKGENKIFQESISEEGTFSPHPSLVFHNDGYYYDTSLNYKTDMYFMEEILCSGDKNLYNIQQPLYISLVVENDQNLSKQWVSFQNVLQYSWRTRDPSPLLKQLYHYVHPSKSYPANHIDHIWENKDLREVQELHDDEFTRVFLDYIDDYIVPTKN